MDPEIKWSILNLLKVLQPFWIINTSRGKNIVTADLVAALKAVKY
jgi:D-3-phosphoglycerate dehydrogenase